jgi:hypothetical protein
MYNYYMDSDLQVRVAAFDWLSEQVNSISIRAAWRAGNNASALSHCGVPVLRTAQPLEI